MIYFEAVIYLWFFVGFIMLTRGIWLFERKGDERPLKFIVSTCPHRYKFTAGTVLLMVAAGYFGAMALVPLFAANFVGGWIQRAFVYRWIRQQRIAVPPDFKK
jgi:hypothetical protein